MSKQVNPNKNVKVNRGEYLQEQETKKEDPQKQAKVEQLKQNIAQKSKQFTDKAIADKIKGEQKIEFNDYFAGEDETDVKALEEIQREIPNDYCQHKKNEELTGQKTDYDFNKYTINLQAEQLKQQQLEEIKQKQQQVDNAVKTDVICKKAYSFSWQQNLNQDEEKIEVHQKIDMEQAKIQKMKEVINQTKTQKSNFSFSNEKNENKSSNINMNVQMVVPEKKKLQITANPK